MRSEANNKDLPLGLALPPSGSTVTKIFQVGLDYYRVFAQRDLVVSGEEQQ